MTKVKKQKKLQINHYDLAQLTEEARLYYRPFIIPSSLSTFDKIQNPETFKLTVVEAKLENELRGVALIQFNVNNRTGELFSLFVQEEYRRQGIGTSLFKSFEDLLLKEGSRALGFQYNKEDPLSIAIDKILANQDWPPAKVYLIRCLFDVYQFNPPWFQKTYKLAKGLKSSPWKKIRAPEKAHIKNFWEQGTFMPYLYPFNEEKTIDPINSLILRHKHQLIGWMITNRIDNKTIRYTSLYIDREYMLKGYAIILLMQAIHLQKKSGVQWAYFEVNLEHIDDSWWKFVKKRLIPYADRVEKMKWAFRIFNLD